MENNIQNMLSDIQTTLSRLKGKFDRLQEDVSEIKDDVKNLNVHLEEVASKGQKFIPKFARLKFHRQPLA